MNFKFLNWQCHEVFAFEEKSSLSMQNEHGQIHVNSMNVCTPGEIHWRLIRDDNQRKKDLNSANKSLMHFQEIYIRIHLYE